MKYFVIVITAVALIGIGGFVVVKNNSGESTKTQTNQKQTIGNKVVSNGGQLIDVRTPEEFATSHAKNAVNIPITVIQAGDLSKIDKSKPIYLYCRTGHRAGLVKTILEQAGYKNVTNIGGLTDWQSQDGEVVTS